MAFRGIFVTSLPLFGLILCWGGGRLQEIEATWLSPCSNDTDCNLPNERCFNLGAMGCSTKGYCGCPKGMGYDYNATTCRAIKLVALGANCTFFGRYFSKTVGYEKHVSNAVCSDPNDKYAYLYEVYGVSMCEDGFSQSGSTCEYNFGKNCSKSSDCGSGSAKMICKSSQCQCDSGYKLSPKSGLCDYVDAGDPCERDGNCWPLGQMLDRGSVGSDSYSCVNKTCACSPDYQLALVNDISFNETSEKMSVRSASYCFPKGNNNSFNLGANDQCRVVPYSPAKTQFAVCGKNYGCYLCPGEKMPDDGITYTCRLIAATPITNSTGTNNSIKKNHAGYVRGIRAEWLLALVSITTLLIMGKLII